MDVKQEGSLNQKPVQLLLRISGFIKPFLPLLALTLILNTFFSIFAAVTIGVIKPLLDIIFMVDNPIDAVIPAVKNDFFQGIKDYFYNLIHEMVNRPDDISGTLLRLSAFIILIFIIKNIFKFWSSITQAKLEEGIIKSIRDKVFSNLANLSVDFFSKNKQGVLLSAITNDVAVLNTSTIGAFTNGLREIVQIVIFISFLLIMSPYLTFIAFSSSIAGVLLLKIAMKYIRRYASRMQSAMADYTTSMQETISGIRVVKAYNAEKNAIDRFKSQTLRYIASTIKLRKVMTIIPSVNEVFAITALCVVLYVGGMQVLVTKELTGSDLLTFILVIFAVMSPIAIIYDNISKFQQGFVSAERVFRILDSQPSVKSGDKKIQTFSDSIEINNVNFAYQEIGVIKDASLIIPKSKKIAFVGASGSGKSTMLDLIIRFYDPVDGSIKMDSTNIKEFDLNSYRGLFGIVSQDTMLFNDTVMNNIKYGFESATKEKITEAAKIANAYDFIMHLPHGFNTYVGDRGIMLSGGERQRIAIARALVRNPQILVFDEATSALDAESEKIVQDAINNSLENKTAVIVAHRLATIINCDEIHVFDGGKIVESGSHKELMTKNGIYRKLYDIQFASNA